MTAREEYIVRSQTPERALEIVNTSQAVDSLIAQSVKHKFGVEFTKRLWPLLERYIVDEKSVKTDEIVAVCNAEMPHLKLSAQLFCEEAFHREIPDVQEENRHQKEKEKAWRYRELADYLNNQNVAVNKELLDWAYFNWSWEFASTFVLDDTLIGHLISQINPDDIKATRHNRENIHYGGDMLELPEWILFLIAYLEERKGYGFIRNIFDALRDAVLQDALAYHLDLPDTFVEVMKVNPAIPKEYCLVLLSHWYRQLVEQSATLRAYHERQTGEQIVKDGATLFRGFEAGMSQYVKESLSLFGNVLSMHDVEKWYFAGYRYLGQSTAGIMLSENVIRQHIDKYVEAHFAPDTAMDDFDCADYLVFLGNQCERLNHKVLAQTIQRAYHHYLYSKEIFRLPQFGDEWLELLRGYSLPIRMNKSHIAEYRQLMEQYMTRHEGLGARVSQDFNDKVTRESFVLSSLILIAEDDDLVEEERKTIFYEVLSHTFKQIHACWMDHLQERYADVMRVAYLVACQQWKDEKENFEKRLAVELDSLLMVASVLSLSDEQLSDQAVHLLMRRWDHEKMVLNIRCYQTHRMNLYRNLEKWIEKLVS